MIKTVWKRIAAAACLLVLQACSVLPQSESLSVYRLPETTLALERESTRPLVLRVATPYGSQLLDSERILVIPRNSRISAYKGARWSDPAPVLVRDRLVDLLRTTGGYRMVGAGQDGTQADFVLGGDLVAFQSEYDQAGQVSVHVGLDVALVRADTGRVAATRRFRVRVPVADTQVDGAVQAFGQATDQLIQQLQPWLSQQMSALSGRQTH